ncbi:MAG TPA: winged helix-turn-helix domain-containing protein [Pyrinomonadaceae bacterium]|nr:winged helix-turn-helix domain-containing protein [Pyrinomonadaceae bacterium]
MNELPNKIISFAEFELDTIQRRLLRGGETVALNSKAFDLLAFLAHNNGRIISKEEILDAVWNEQFVEESNLVVQISNLRKVLGEQKNAPRFLVTVPGKGYKFVADTSENLLLIETHSISELTIEHEEITEFGRAEIIPQSETSNLKWFASAGFLILIAGAVVWFWNKNAPPPKPKQTKLTKLTTSGKIVNATLSPDGKFGVFAQKEDAGESLWLRQLETGSEQRIAAPQPHEYVGMTVSPDNQFIYASVFSKNDIDPQLLKIPILGGVSQAIPNISTGASISISPDGKQFAFTDSNNAEKETMFGIAEIDGTNQRILIRAKHDTRYFEMFKSSPVAWSPNGAEIAVAVLEKTGNHSAAKILMINPRDGNERYLTEKSWQSLSHPTWLDEDNLAFIASEEDGMPNQVWTFSRKTGETKPITNELQTYNWLAAAKGKILAVQVNVLSSLLIANFTETEKMLDVREIFTASDQIDLADWSANGEIIYASGASGKRELWRMNRDGTNQKQITFGANIRFGLTVSNDGNLFFASRQSDKKGIWQTDQNGKNLKQLSTEIDQLPDISNDGKLVFHRGLGYAEGIFLTSKAEPNPRLLKEKCYFPAISPDGAQMACYFMDWENDRKWRIALVSTDSGALIKKLDLPLPIYERQIRFHPSGKYLTQIFSAGDKLKIILLPLNGGEAKIYEGLGKGSSNLPEWSPDGKQFLYPLINESQDAVLLTDL